MEFDPARLAVKDRYRLMSGVIVPRPIAVVSTCSTDGKPNLAPFSFFTGVGSDPMTLIICPVNAPDGSEKDTLRNAKPVEEGGTGEFVVGVATKDNIRQVVGASEPLAFGKSEFELTGLTAAPSAKVRPPRVAESPVSFECRTIQVIRTNPGKPGGGNVVLGRVVHVHVREDVIDAKLRVSSKALAAIGRMGGLEYTRTDDLFTLPLGRRALEP
ncbi:MAG: flavin reductase family protein [Planctomycetes bacterium]|nr:flavin reductase family protein [Planctomycetota bacterium]